MTTTRAAVLDVENAADALRDVEKLLAALGNSGFMIDPAALDPVSEGLATRIEALDAAIERLRAQVVQ